MSKNQAAKTVTDKELKELEGQANALAVVPEAQPSVVQDIKQTMAETGISASDLVIPKLLLMQNTSEAVGDNKAKLGDILNSQSNEVLGGLEKPVELIPLRLFKTWRVMDMSGKQAEFKRSEPVTAKNEKLPWEDMEDGKPIRRDYCFNFFCLLVDEVEKDEAFPVVVQFKRTSANAGKSLATQLFKMAALGRLTYSQTIKLAVRKDKFEQNTYALFETVKGSQTNAKGLESAKAWMGRLSSMTYTVDEQEDDVQPAAAPAPTVVGAAAPADIF